VFDTDGEDDLVDADASNGTLGLTPGTTHTLLKTIGTGTGKHSVDTNVVERVNADTEVEVILVDLLDEVLVDDNTGSLKSVGGDLLELTRDEVNAETEGVRRLRAVTDVIDSDLRLGYTTKVARLGVRLVFLVSVALSGSSSHTINF
jgi:hypothetical protein